LINLRFKRYLLLNWIGTIFINSLCISIEEL